MKKTIATIASVLSLGISCSISSNTPTLEECEDKFEEELGHIPNPIIQLFRNVTFEDADDLKAFDADIKEAEDATNEIFKPFPQCRKIWWENLFEDLRENLKHCYGELVTVNKNISISDYFYVSGAFIIMAELMERELPEDC